MTEDQLRETIDYLRRAGTDTTAVEAKASQKDLPKDMWRAVSAFANTPGQGGGIIILGLDESSGFSAVGVDDAKKIQATLDGLLGETMEPPMRAPIEIVEFEGKQLVICELAELSYREKPCFNKNKGIERGSCIRSGDSNRDMTTFEIQMMLASRGQPDDDAQPVRGTSIDDLDDELKQAFLDRARTRRNFNGDSDEEVLVRNAEGDLATSLAGLMVLGGDPSAHLDRPGAVYVQYPTDVAGEDPDGTRFLDSEDLSHLPIPKIVDWVLGRLDRTLAKRVVIEDGKGQQVWEYPKTAIREALVNALGHRSYHAMTLGSPVQVELYPSRLVIRNPGGLHGPVSEEELGNPGLTSDRNPKLMRILADTPYEGGVLCENRGSGLPAII